MAKHPIPEQFKAGAQAVRTFGPNGRGVKLVTVTRVTKTLLTDSEGSRYYAMAGSEDNGRLYAYGSQGAMWPAQLHLAATQEEGK